MAEKQSASSLIFEPVKPVGIIRTQALKYVMYLFCLITLGSAKGQASSQIKIDSFKNLVNKSTDDTTRIKYLISLYIVTRGSNPMEGKKIITRAFKLSQKTKFKKGEMLSNYYMGSHMGAYEIDYKASFTYYQQALSLARELGKEKFEARINTGLAFIYAEQGQLERALKTYKMASDIYSRKEMIMDKALVQVGASDIYCLQNDFAKAQHVIEKAIKETKKYKNDYVSARLHMALSGTFHKRKSYPKAVEASKQAIYLFHKINDLRDFAFSQTLLAQIYVEMDKLDEAQIWADSALKLCNEYKLAKEKSDAYNVLENIYLKKKDYKQAYHFKSKLLALKDSTFSHTQAFEIANIEASIEQAKKDAIAEEKLESERFIRNSFIGGFAIMLLSAVLFFVQRNRIKEGKKHSDELLLNILPQEVAEELKHKGKADAKHFSNVTVMFTDFKDFTAISSKLSPEDLVTEIHACFKAFDDIIGKYGIEKIKTIGDAYMCAGGLPIVNTTNAVDVVRAGLEIQAFLKERAQKRKEEEKVYFEARLGIHTGSVVAGIVGVKKFAYDIWGDTVNTASRMESGGEVGKVNISHSTYDLVKDNFTCEYRGAIQAKGKGKIDMYFVDY